MRLQAPVAGQTSAAVRIRVTTAPLAYREFAYRWAARTVACKTSLALAIQDAGVSPLNGIRRTAARWPETEVADLVFFTIGSEATPRSIAANSIQERIAGVGVVLSNPDFRGNDDGDADGDEHE